MTIRLFGRTFYQHLYLVVSVHTYSTYIQPERGKQDSNNNKQGAKIRISEYDDN